MRSSSKKETVYWLDELIGLLLELSLEKSQLSGLDLQNIHSRIHYLRELRAIALDIDEEQVREFCRDLGINMANIQFQLWRGSSEELFEILAEDSES